mmetsp:Transcript_163353/g.289275  ORF Transcript_163353/g.289275 Transcript_163353/m.289275 type:complete len:83 (-) Transcript_163353:146-394(-)
MRSSKAAAISDNLPFRECPVIATWEVSIAGSGPKRCGCKRKSRTRDVTNALAMISIMVALGYAAWNAGAASRVSAAGYMTET